MSTDFRKTWLAGAALSAGLGLGGAAWGQTAPAPENTQGAPAGIEQRVQDLLARAVEHVRRNGPVAVNDFNRDARFTDKDLYVYALSRDGMMLASGGWSATLVGQSVLGETDARNRPFFKEMLEQAQRQPAGSLEYYWFNPAEGQPELKVAYYQEVDGVVVATGYFPARATENQAKELLDEAVSRYFQDPELALRQFANRQGAFTRRDLYVFVLDIPSRTVVLNGANRSFDGKPVTDFKDLHGKMFLVDMLADVDRNVIHAIDYDWMNPETRRVERKRAFYQRVGDALIGVGSYHPAQASPKP
ncbi:cache domain-containing protein [Alcaligenes sp. SDU_A2]|uniref:cache domain-containing protein n=1 Tax=Alcaligenes sp. SDU_A2 TaxID=3136634 RepID=UPI002BC8AB67|nr:cache domain-containing protein [Alcaligenes sp.]HRL28024.1 cache domain-containing protein [Alcaligenes sp.]